MPSDIFLVRNINQIAKFGLTFPPIKMIAISLVFVLILILHYNLRKKNFEKTKLSLKNDFYSIPLFIIGILMIWYVCIATNRFDKYKIKNELVDNYNWMGGNATFFIHLGDLYTMPSEEYNEDNINKLKVKYTKAEKISNENKPNVVIIMIESFSAPNKKNVKYSINPMKEIINLAQNDKNCAMGNTISPVFGGGTSISEFEVLTGLSTYFIEKQIMPYTSYIRSNMNSIVRTYKNNEYTAIGIHPYTKTFYNRIDIYKYLGFDKAIFEEEMEEESEPEKKGQFISDNEFANQIIDSFKKTDGRKFIFGVTMQNHMKYIDKNYEKLDIDVESDELNEEERFEIQNYVQGIYDGNKMYIKLVEYLKQIEEPTILVMFGDHLPTTINNIFDKSDFAAVDYYTTPYIVWTNYDVDYENYLKEYMSPSALTLGIADLANIELPWYMNAFKEMYESYPVISNQFVIDKDYNVMETEKVKDEFIVKMCNILQYDLLIEKKYIPVK